jgi:hypothetical protein
MRPQRLSKKMWQSRTLPPPDEPEWQPLLDFAPDHVGDFMWMFAVELEDGRRLEAYKHRWSVEQAKRARQDSNLRPLAPEASALSS